MDSMQILSNATLLGLRSRPHLHRDSKTSFEVILPDDQVASEARQSLTKPLFSLFANALSHFDSFPC